MKWLSGDFAAKSLPMTGLEARPVVPQPLADRSSWLGRYDAKLAAEQ